MTSPGPARGLPSGPSSGRIRVVVGTFGPEGHDRAAEAMARTLRDAGHEVIYVGLHQAPEQVVETAIQEDADVIGLSVLAGDAPAFFARLMDLLAERDATDIAVLAGGHLPAADVPALERLGVAAVVPPEASPGEVARWVAEHVTEQAGETGPVRGG